MKVISNQLNVSFDYLKIDQDFDFYVVATSDKYIPSGSQCLDGLKEFKAESLAFENGKTLYVMTRKGCSSRMKLANHLNNDKLFVRNTFAKEIEGYVLFRLFLYSLNNFNSEKISFNNLTGKFYIFNPKWMKKNRSSFIGLGINVDSDMNLIVESATFAKYSLFKNNAKVKDCPKYTFANKNNALKRVFSFENEDEIYIKKGIYNKKAEIPFLTLAKNDLKECKAYYVYKILSLLADKYKEYFDFSFKCVDSVMSIGVEKDKMFMNYALTEFMAKQLNFVNLVNGAEYEGEFQSLIEKIADFTGIQFLISSSIACDKNNIVLIHNKEYYQQNDYPDIYKKFDRSSVIQCVTVEDSVEKIIDDNQAIIDTIIKETVIKNDILNTRKISLDNWSEYKFKTDWIFGKEKDGKHYFLVIHPDGKFDLFSKVNDFSSLPSDILNACSDYLTDNKGKEKTVIADDIGNINVISRTNKFPLPSEKLFEQEFVSRSKQSREQYLSGVVDINLYNDEGVAYYSVGLKGNGMNTKIVRAPHLYRVDVIDGENIMTKILSTLSAYFVKYKSFTVLPYPIKYLNEYILMDNV